MPLTFGIGATPNVLDVIRAGASVAGVANRSDRATTHVADAEGGHVEDDRVTGFGAFLRATHFVVGGQDSCFVAYDLLDLTNDHVLHQGY